MFWPFSNGSKPATADNASATTDDSASSTASSFTTGTNSNSASNGTTVSTNGTGTSVSGKKRSREEATAPERSVSQGEIIAVLRNALHAPNSCVVTVFDQDADTSNDIRSISFTITNARSDNAYATVDELHYVHQFINEAVLDDTERVLHVESMQFAFDLDPDPPAFSLKCFLLCRGVLPPDKKQRKDQQDIKDCSEPAIAYAKDSACLKHTEQIVQIAKSVCDRHVHDASASNAKFVVRAMADQDAISSASRTKICFLVKNLGCVSFEDMLDLWYRWECVSIRVDLSRRELSFSWFPSPTTTTK